MPPMHLAHHELMLPHHVLLFFLFFFFFCCCCRYVQLDKILPQLCKQPLKLEEVSPKLRGLRNLQLDVPGTYLRTPRPVLIDRFVPQLKVGHALSWPPASCILYYFC